MSHLLEQLEGRERRAECLRNEAALNGVPFHRCRFFNGRCIDCGRSYGGPRGPEARAFFAECEAEARDVMRNRSEK